jgi:hypothetical protein
MKPTGPNRAVECILGHSSVSFGKPVGCRRACQMTKLIVVTLLWNAAFLFTAYPFCPCGLRSF